MTGPGPTDLKHIIPYAQGTVDLSPLSQQAISRNPDSIMTGNGGARSRRPHPEDGEGTELQQKSDSWCKGLAPSDILEMAGEAACDNAGGMAWTEDTPDIMPLMKELMPVQVKSSGYFENNWYLGFDNIHLLVQVIEKARKPEDRRRDQDLGNDGNDRQRDGKSAHLRDDELRH
jgi:hypothetical protein